MGKVEDIGDGVSFAGNCPLWTYVLAETKRSLVDVVTLQGTKSIESRKLGLVGGTIVAETCIGLLLADSSSYLSLDPLWQPEDLAVDGVFGLRKMIQYALED